jgi:O-antigen/teichoic acid export membrane protein
MSFVTVPVYLRLIGPERYGVLAIAWLLLGYFGLFDLGLGRATSFRIAALRGADGQARSDTFWAALAINIGMGLIGALILWLAADQFFGHVFKINASVRPEIIAAVPLLALSVPVATVAGVLSGALQGEERLLEVNVISTVSTALFQLLPLSIAWLVGPNILYLLTAALSARFVSVLVLGIRCYATIVRGHRRRLAISEIPVLLKFGGWVSLVSIFGPMLQIVDRFVIGAVLGAVAVTIYTVPFQLASRMQQLSSSLTDALFPRMSASPLGDVDRLALQSARTMIAIMTLPIFGAIFLMEPFLRVWVGSAIAVQSAPIGRIVLLGFWFNAFALISFVRLQASGRPDIVSKFVVAQVPPYLVALYFGLKYLGFEGCALAFTVRCVSDYVWLTFLAARKLPYFSLTASALIALVAAIYLAGQFPLITDWRWWASASVIGAVLALISAVALPAAMAQQLWRPISAVVSRYIGGRLLDRSTPGSEFDQ